MDRHTLDLLQFDEIRQLVASYASSPLGKELARELAPMQEVDAIAEAIGRVTEMVDALGARLNPPLQGLRDVRVPARRAELGVLLEVEPLLQIRDVCELTGRVREYWLRLEADYPRLSLLLSDVHDLREVASRIDEVVDGRGFVRDDASPGLASIRAQLAALDERIQQELKRILRNPEVRGALRYPQPTVSGDHHVLAVAVNHRHKVAGVVHRASSSGETLYIEPARIAEIAANRALIKTAEAREERKVLRQLTTLVGRSAPALLASLDVLAQLDLTHAKAHYSQAFSMSAPEVAEGGPLYLRRARHPILEHLFRIESAEAKDGEELKQVVPIDVTLGEAFDLLVVTGPNTGGKTVALKTVGLIAAMAQCGLHIPAATGSRTPLLEEVLADIGDEQSLEQSLSTFSSHISQIARILEQAGPGTLVLLDEMGAGTEPTEGAALGRAILDELLERGVLAMVTTHLGDLKTYAFSQQRVENAAMEFDPQSLQPTYVLTVGQYGQSCALKIARRLRLPRPLLHRAHQYLRRRGGKATRELDEVQRMRFEAQQAREQAEAARRQASEAEDEYRRRTDQLQQEAEVSAEIEKARSAMMPGDTVRVARFDKRGKVVRVDWRRGLAAVTVGAVEWELPLSEIIPEK